jgi:hypothetical protein
VACWAATCALWPDALASACFHDLEPW